MKDSVFRDVKQVVPNKHSGMLYFFFQDLEIKTKGINNAHFQYFFINGIKEDTKEQVDMYHPTTWLDAS